MSSWRIGRPQKGRSDWEALFVDASGGHILFVCAKRIWKEKRSKGGARRAAPPLRPTPGFRLTHRHMPGNLFAAYCAAKYPLPVKILKTPALNCAGGALKRCCQGCTGEVPRRGHNGRVPSLACFFFCHFFLHEQKEMVRSPFITFSAQQKYPAKRRNIFLFTIPQSFADTNDSSQLCIQKF